MNCWRKAAATAAIVFLEVATAKSSVQVVQSHRHSKLSFSQRLRGHGPLIAPPQAGPLHGGPVPRPGGPLATPGATTHGAAGLYDVKKAFAYIFFYAFVILSLAGAYRFLKRDSLKVPEDGNEHSLELLERNWRYNVFDCCGNVPICCVSCLCPGIRWADTMRMAGFLSFWTALALWVIPVILMPFVGISFIMFVCVAVIYRQRLRSKFRIQHGTFGTYAEDCLLYGCCMCCAVVQEARQMEEAYMMNHSIWAAETIGIDGRM